MSDNLVDAQTRLALRADKSAMEAARRDVVVRVRKGLRAAAHSPANDDRDPKAA